MASHKSHTVLVYDNGLFVELAVTLAKSFGRVLYYAPWENGYPRSNALRIGDGIKGVERVASIWPHVDDVDLFVFPDVYEGALQTHLADLGKRVWGCRMGEELELDRVASKAHCASLGIDIGPYTVLTGVDALRKHLKANDDQWVKISLTRGDMETFHSKNYELSEPIVNELQHALGAKEKIMEFIVEQGINPALEVGYDGYTIDGKFPNNAIIGVEVKDKAYVGRTMRYNAMPDQVRLVNGKLASTLKRYRYRGFISTELRCTDDGKAYLIDPCARCGSPPSELYHLMIANLADILWEGADGIVIEPEYKAKYGAMVMLLSLWADKNWQQVTFPEKIRDNVKLRNMTMVDGEWYVIPQWTGMPEIGAVVAMGDTAEAAVEECKRVAALVEGHTIEKPADSLDEALENLTDYLGEEREPTRLERKADGLRKRGKISEKQYDKLQQAEG